MDLCGLAHKESLSITPCWDLSLAWLPHRLGTCQQCSSPQKNWGPQTGLLPNYKVGGGGKNAFLSQYFSKRSS